MKLGDEIASGNSSMYIFLKLTWNNERVSLSPTAWMLLVAKNSRKRKAVAAACWLWDWASCAFPPGNPGQRGACLLHPDLSKICPMTRIPGKFALKALILHKHKTIHFLTSWWISFFNIVLKFSELRKRLK